MSVVISSNLDKDFSNIIKTIQLDVERTFFDQDVEISRRVN